MFAGNLRGVTQTLPLLIYQDFELDFDVSLAISALLVVVSAAVLITVKLIVRASARARGGESPVSIALFRPGRLATCARDDPLPDIVAVFLCFT